jgi:two-component system, cell cycle sensor histidine kinase and response regulator CckA
VSAVRDSVYERLRRLAEEKLTGEQSDAGPLSRTEARALLHELHVHQQELEIQCDELRSAQEDLSRSRDRYMKIFHRAPVGYAVIDANGIIAEANLRLGEMLQEEVSDLIGHALSDWILEADRPVYWARFRALLDRPEGKTLESRMRRADGGAFHVEMNARREDGESGRRLFLTVMDVTENRQLIATLRAAHKEWELTFNATPDLVSVVDREYRLVRVNRAMADRLGAEPEDLVGKRCFEAFGAGALCEGCPHNRVLEEGRILTGEVALGALGGSFQVSCSPYYDRDGTLCGTVHVAHDLTPLREAERERIDMERRMLGHQKFESIGVLAGGIAHDFNNILHAIIGNAEMAMDEIAQSSPAHEWLREIVAGSEHASAICDQMLTFAGQGTRRHQAFNLCDLIASMHDLLKVSVKKNVSLRLGPRPDRPCAVKGDPSQLRQVVLNLVVNASEATGDKAAGSVDLSAAIRRFEEGAPEAPDDWVTGIPAPGEYVQVAVTDQGCGISPDMRARVFDPFYTTKFTGRGLGLATVLGIVRAHEGYLKLESRAGEGSCFFFYLPFYREAIEEAKPRAEGRREAGSGTILVVDDELSILKSTTRGLSRRGYEILQAEDGPSALGLIREKGGGLKAVVLDMTMPVMSGAEVFAEIRKDRPGLPVILSSGYEENEVWGSVRKDDRTSFLHKPHSFEELRRAIESLAGSSSPDDSEVGN